MNEWASNLNTFLATLGLLLELVAMTMIPLVLVRKKDPGATLAWIMALLFLPALGIFMFLLFGRSRIRWPAKRKRLADKSLQGHLIGFRETPSNIRKPHVSLAGYGAGLFQVAEVLSRGRVTSGNIVNVLTNGEQAYQCLGEAVDAAQDTVHAAYYQVRGDHTGRWFFDKLIAAARRGVEVRLLCDGLGSLGMPRSWIRQLREAGGEFSYFFPLATLLTHPIGLRNHRKLVVIDGMIGFAGGLNIADEYHSGAHGKQAWRDTLLRVTGPIVGEIQNVFLRDWTFAAGLLKVESRYFPRETSSPSLGALASIITSGPDSDSEAIHRIFWGAIVGARERVYVTTPYFVPDRAICIALQMAALQGVDVRILVPRHNNHATALYAGRSFYDELLEAGVKLYEYLPSMNHAKTMIVDKSLALVGSANMDVRSFRLNFEVHVLLSHEATVSKLERAFLKDLAQSETIDLDSWRVRSSWERVKEGAARLLSPLL